MANNNNSSTDQTNVLTFQINMGDYMDQLRSIVREEMAVIHSPGNSPANIEPTITQNQLCEYLGITAQTVIRLKKKKKIPFILLGSHPRFILTDVLKALGK